MYCTLCNYEYIFETPTYAWIFLPTLDMHTLKANQSLEILHSKVSMKFKEILGYYHSQYPTDQLNVKRQTTVS